jgi:hypothetical protein
MVSFLIQFLGEYQYHKYWFIFFLTISAPSFYFSILGSDTVFKLMHLEVPIFHPYI